MNAVAIPGMGILRRTPEILGWLVADLDEADTLWKPAPERWCVLEVVGHLAHIERPGFRGRAEAILTRENPTLPGIDPEREAATGLYAARPLGETLALFAAERRQSLELLARVRGEDLARPGVHGDLGPVTLEHLLNEWPLHDLGHVRQVAELVRARCFHPKLGPWQGIYRLRP
jgi:hypothetical protein